MGEIVAESLSTVSIASRVDRI